MIMKSAEDLKFNLSNKNVVITGGAGGVGSEIVKLFVKKGANVLFLDVNKSKGERLQKELSGKAKFIYCDISNKESVQQAVNECVHYYKRINVLVNNAAILKTGKFTETEFTDIIETNLIGTMSVTQLLLSYMQKGDAVLNVLSVHATVVRENNISYDVSNAALLMFTKTLAKELKPRNITVNALSFLAANTKMLTAETRKKLKTISEPNEIAAHIATVVENFSLHTTGSNFVLDEI